MTTCLDANGLKLAGRDESEAAVDVGATKDAVTVERELVVASAPCGIGTADEKCANARAAKERRVVLEGILISELCYRQGVRSKEKGGDAEMWIAFDDEDNVSTHLRRAFIYVKKAVQPKHDLKKPKCGVYMTLHTNISR